MCESTTDMPRKLAEQLAQILIEHVAESIIIPVHINSHVITVTIKYEREIMPFDDIDNAVIDLGGIY